MHNHTDADDFADDIDVIRGTPAYAITHPHTSSEYGLHVEDPYNYISYTIEHSTMLVLVST